MAHRIAHISDLHLPPMPGVAPHQVLNKRLLGYLSWHRKRKHRHRPEVVAALEADLRERGADHICITGDITNLGLPQEFQHARDWLEGLGSRDSVTLVPGNHDSYVSGSGRAMQRYLDGWVPDNFPAAVQRDDVLYIAVTTAVPTPPFMATGRLGRDQLERLERLLGETPDRDLRRILLIHHPPVPGVVTARKALTDAAALARVLFASPVDLVLHGHGHRPAQHTLESRTGPIPVLGAGSASLAHPDPARSGHYHFLELEGRTLTVTHCRYDSARGRFGARQAAATMRL